MSTTAARSHEHPRYRFHCNICLDAVLEPVVTQCGHLYCWPCLYRWLEPGMLPGERLVGGSLEVDESRRVCPVCKAPCSVPTVVPIYALVEQPIRNDTTARNVLLDKEDTMYNEEEEEEQEELSTLRHRRIPARPSRPRTIPEPTTPRSSEVPVPSHSSPSRPLARLYHSHYPYYSSDPNATEYLSRILLILGSFVIVCLLLF